jgi:glutathione peroxidase
VELRRRTGASPKWNFHKYVVSRDGNAVQSFASTVEPDDAAFVREIERQLGAK